MRLKVLAIFFLATFRQDDPCCCNDSVTIIDNILRNGRGAGSARPEAIRGRGRSTVPEIVGARCIATYSIISSGRNRQRGRTSRSGQEWPPEFSPAPPA